MHVWTHPKSTWWDWACLEMLCQPFKCCTWLLLVFYPGSNRRRIARTWLFNPFLIFGISWVLQLFKYSTVRTWWADILWSEEAQILHCAVQAGGEQRYQLVTLRRVLIFLIRRRDRKRERSQIPFTKLLLLFRKTHRFNFAQKIAWEEKTLGRALQRQFNIFNKENLSDSQLFSHEILKIQWKSAFNKCCFTNFIVCLTTWEY